MKNKIVYCLLLIHVKKCVAGTKKQIAVPVIL